jgi:hypothetical protein
MYQSVTFSQTNKPHAKQVTNYVQVLMKFFFRKNFPFMFICLSIGCSATVTFETERVAEHL